MRRAAGRAGRVAARSWPLALGAARRQPRGHRGRQHGAAEPAARSQHHAAARADRPGVLALTFDDGPDPDVTPRVLALLDQAGAVADVLLHRAPRRAAPRSHRRHPRARPRHREPHLQPPTRVSRSAGRPRCAPRSQRGQAALTAAGAARPRFFRAPAGHAEPVAARRCWRRKGCRWCRGRGAASTPSPATRASWPGGWCGTWPPATSCCCTTAARRAPPAARRSCSTPRPRARSDGRARPPLDALGAMMPAPAADPAPDAG